MEEVIKIKNISYKKDLIPDISKIIDLYINSGINRPVNDHARIEKMFKNSNLIITAWDNEILVGIGRALTDHCYATYLSDLAVRDNYKKNGIGTNIISVLKKIVGEESMLLLLSAKEAMSYYRKISNDLNFTEVDNGFIIKRTK